MLWGGLIPTPKILSGEDLGRWPRGIIEEIMTLRAIVRVRGLELIGNLERKYRHATRR
jgi:hypothetical protein